MNKAYRLIWSEILQTWIAVAECVRGRGKKAAAVCLAGLAPAALAAPPAATALPGGGQVVAGQAAIVQSGTRMDIRQDSAKAIINWQNFDIGSGARVDFHQPSAGAVALNRVLSTNPSQIYGQLSANGQVFLVNPNGIVFGPGARVDVGGIVASTRHLADGDFLAGNYRFAGGGGAIGNEGAVAALPHGYVAFIAPRIGNAGSIEAPQGTAALAAGDTVTLQFAGDRLLSYDVSAARVNTLIENQGAIRAAGGLVLLTAKSAGELATSAINHTGLIDASSASAAGGVVRLEGASEIRLAGKLAADGAGQGGSVVVIADMDHGRTRVEGEISARGGEAGGDGGFVETSGAHVQVAESARISTLAARGRAGTWLVDPNDYIVAAAANGGDIDGATLATSLGSGNVVIQSSKGKTAGDGGIVVKDAVSWTSDTTLTLAAERDIYIDANISATGPAAGLKLYYGGTNGTTSPMAGTTFKLGTTAKITLSGTTPTLFIGNVQPTVINSLAALQNMSSSLSGWYALGSDIDASATSGWNSGAGFAPIGDSTNKFTGAFHGMGHTISSLTINRTTTDYVGLFGYVGSAGKVGYVELTGGSVAGDEWVGALAGGNDGTIASSKALTTVTGTNCVGGLVGINYGNISYSSASGGVGSAGGPVNVGGLVGWNEGPIGNSGASGAVAGSGAVGGLAGGNRSTIEYSYASGIVSGTGSNIGGLVGLNGDSTSGYIKNSYATGSVSGGSNVGGLVGSNGNGTAASSIGYSYAVGAVSGITTGGLVGVNGSNGTVSDSYWDTTTTGQNSSSGIGSNSGTSSGIAGYATATMQTQATFTGWDFDYNWQISPYPTLRTGAGYCYTSGVNCWSGGAGDSQWFSIGNWTAGHVPTSSESVYIDVAATPTIAVSGADVSIGSLKLGENLTVSGAYNFTVSSLFALTGGLAQFDNTGASGTTVNSLSLVGGTLKGSGAFNVGNSFSLGSGTIDRSGTMSVTRATGDLSFSATNVGTLSLTASAGSLSLGAVTSSGDIGATAGGAGTDAIPVPGTFINGLLDAGGGSSKVVISDSRWVKFDNSGSVVDANKVEIVAGASGVAQQATGSGSGFASSYLAVRSSGPVSLLSDYNSFGYLTLDAASQTSSIKTTSALMVATQLLGGSSFAGVKAGTLTLNAPSLGQQTGADISAASFGGVNFTGNVDLQNSGNALKALGAITAGGYIKIRSADSSGLSIANPIQTSGSGKEIFIRIDSGDLTLASGAGFSNAGAVSNSNAVVLATPADFKNTGGATIATGTGRWLVYANSPSSIVKGGLTSNFRRYNADFDSPTAGYPPANVTETGNGFIYRTQPTLAVTTTLSSGSASHVYGDSPNAVFGYSLPATFADSEDTAANIGLPTTPIVTFNVPISGSNAGSYNVAYASGLSSSVGYAFVAGTTYPYTVAKRGLTAAIVNSPTKVYDGTAGATLSAGNFSLSGFVGGEGGSVIQTAGSYNSSHVAGASTVSASLGSGDFAAGGSTLLSNYNLPTSASGAGAITPRTVTPQAGATAATKVYDGTTAVPAGFSPALQAGGAIAGDSVALTWSSAQYDSKDVASAAKVVLNGIAIGSISGSSGSVASDYQLTTASAGIAGSITPRPLTLSGSKAASKVYDGTAAAAVTAGTLGGLLGLESLAVQASGAFADKNAGSGKSVTASYTLADGANGGLGGNYSLAGEKLSADITPASLAVTGVSARNKTYDGATAATLAGSAGVSPFKGDSVTLAGTGSATFADKNVGSGKAVSVSGYTLGGADAGNYVLAQPGGLTADIAPASLAVTGVSARNKIYDGTTAAVLAGTAAISPFAGDSVTLGGAGSGAFADKNVGSGKAVTVGGYTLGGADAGNYQVVQPQGLTADITPATLAYVANAVNSLVGQPVPALGGTVSGLVGGDTLDSAARGSLSWSTSATATSPAGSYAIVGSGLSADNYTFVQAPGNAEALKLAELQKQDSGTIVTQTRTDAVSSTLAVSAFKEPLPTAVVDTQSLTAFAAPSSSSSSTSAASTSLALADASATSPSSTATRTASTADTAASASSTTESSAAADSGGAKPSSAAAAEESAQPTQTSASATKTAAAAKPAQPASAPAGAAAFARVNLAAMSPAAIQAMLTARHEHKTQTFQEALSKLEVDTRLGELPGCASAAAAAGGDCLATPAQMQELAQAAQSKTARRRLISAALPQIEKKVAVLIGINAYQDKKIPSLESAVPDVEAVAGVLEQKLGYDVRILRDSGKKDVVKALNQLAGEIGGNDSVTLYYAGHGYLSEKTKTGYWIPADAAVTDPGGWISNNDISRFLAQLPAKQVMLVSDSCYSGSLTRDSGKDAVGKGSDAKEILGKRSVVVMSSGGEEPVSDEGKDGHSIFAYSLMKALGEVDAWQPGATVFDKVRSEVTKEFPQSPQYGAAAGAGHVLGGEYLFEIRRHD